MIIWVILHQIWYWWKFMFILYRYSKVALFIIVEYLHSGITLVGYYTEQEMNESLALWLADERWMKVWRSVHVLEMTYSDNKPGEWVSFLAERCKDIDMLWTSDNLLTCFYDNELRRLNIYLVSLTGGPCHLGLRRARRQSGIISAREINLHLILYLNSGLPRTHPWARVHPHCHCYKSNTLHLLVRGEGILGAPCSNKVHNTIATTVRTSTQARAI